MGVLNFSGPLNQRQNAVDFDDILSLQLADVHLRQDINENSDQNVNISSRAVKRKRTKSGGKLSYDFRDYGVDARRRGSKHQRRKQNFIDLMQTTQIMDDAVFTDDCWSNGDHVTLFTDLFLDDEKMKVWDDFVRLPEEQQKEYLDQTLMKTKKRNNSDEVNQSGIAGENKDRFYCVDKKLQDMLRSKSLAHMGLLEYYENDVLCCSTESFPSVVVFNVDSSYDRMLIYAICQYMGIPSNTIKLKNSALIEIELPNPSEGWNPPSVKLTEYLIRNKHCRRHGNKK